MEFIWSLQFITFLKQMPAQTDKGLQSFIKYAKKDKRFPLSSDPHFLGFYLHNKLDEEPAMGYMKAMIQYYHMENNMLSNDLKDKKSFLMAVNCIIDLRNQ